MTSPGAPSLIGLAAAWLAWCTLHSLLIATGPTEWLHRRWPALRRYHRLLYNAIATVTLLPCVIWMTALRGPEIVQWNGALRALQLVLIAVAVVLLVAGARAYDLGEFLGLRQLRRHHHRARGADVSGRDGTGATVADEDPTTLGGLKRTGVHAVVRHPWYLAGLILLWARDLDAAALVTSTILSAYLILGAHLEERKLIRSHGDAYRQYQRQVPMLFPWPRQRHREPPRKSES